MKIRIHLEEGEYSIFLFGNLDTSSSQLVNSALNSAMNFSPKRIVINCEDLDYISSAGLGVFLSHVEDLKERGIELKMINMKQKIRKVFELLDLHTLINIEKNRNELLQEINR